MATIYTHVNPDLDAAASVWAWKKFGTGGDEVQLVPADWDGEEITSQDMALDIEAPEAPDTLSIKGRETKGGRVESCFASIIDQYAPEQDARALAPIVDFINIQDSRGAAVNWMLDGEEITEWKETSLSATSLNSTWRALQRTSENDLEAIEKFGEVMEGLFEGALEYQKAVEEAEKADWYGEESRVAVIEDAGQRQTNGILYDQGAKMIVFKDGHNLGVLSQDSDDVSAYHDEIKSVVEEAGELEEWFQHPARFLFARGTRKSPAESPSAVQAEELAEACVRALKRERMQAV